jgi:AcrR family transcriptional regulator
VSEPTAAQVRLLDAAATAFMERGYDATSIDDIAAQIGATKGAVYYSYRSKLDLFLGVYQRGMRALEKRVTEALEEAGDAPAVERLRAVAVAHAHNIMSHFAYHVTIQQGVEHRRQMPLRARERERLAELDALREQHESLVVSLVEAGVADGSLRDVPVRLAARTLIELAGELVDLLLGGLAR